MSFPVNMSQVEIIAARMSIDERWAELRIMQDDLREEQQALIRRCKHPGKYPYSAMGDPGTKCPDCGWQT